MSLRHAERRARTLYQDRIMKNLRILIVDDHEVVRRGLLALLGTQAGWEVVGEAASGSDAVKIVAQTRPDVVIMDITMPTMSGLDATRLIMETAPQTKVLIFTMHDSEQMMQTALEAGARGYVLKSNAASDLITAIRALSKDETPLISRTARHAPKVV
jgi:DNA-binding NarL/FixJ family response regulator